MKIAFDTSDLCTARADGTTRYTYELAKRFPVLAPEYAWNYLAPCDFSANYSLPTTRYKLNPSPWPKYWTQSRMAVDLFRIRPSTLFMPIQQLPIIRPRNMSTVATIHDLAFHYYPEQTAYKDWLLLHTFTAQVAREADHIIAVSQATADDIKKEYGREKNVHVVRHGVDFDHFANDTTDFDDLQNAHPNLTKPYILFVGQIQPRKNLIRLIEAFEYLHKGNSDLQLVIAGGHGWLQEPIFERARNSSVASSIHMLGRVDDKLLPALYKHAEVFVLPSLYEGFGMPILEAMAADTPVVTSNTSCMPEIAGDAAVLVSPTNPVSIARGITEARDRKDELVRKRTERAQQFTWEKTALQTLDVIKKSQPRG